MHNLVHIKTYSYISYPSLSPVLSYSVAIVTTIKILGEKKQNDARHVPIDAYRHTKFDKPSFNSFSRNRGVLGPVLKGQTDEQTKIQTDRMTCIRNEMPTI